MKRQHPPVARMMPLTFWVLRGFGALLLVLSLWTAWLLVEDGQAVSGALVTISGCAFLAATWLNPLSRGFRITFAVAVLAIVALGGPIFALGAVIVGIVWFLLSRLIRINVDPESIRPLEPDAVMRRARSTVDQFNEFGWEQIGAVGATVGRREIVESILIPRPVDRYAQVTDVVVTIVSQIDDNRTLVTRNSGVATVPDSVLTNDLTGASPAELIAGHDAALRVLAGHGAEPVPLVADRIVDRVVRDEKASIAGGVVRMRDRDKPSGPIDRSPEAERRIRYWLGTPTVD